MSNLTFDSVVDEVAKDAIDGKFGAYNPGDMRDDTAGLYQSVCQALSEKIQGDEALTERWLATDVPGADFMEAVADTAQELAYSEIIDLTAGDTEILADEARADVTPQHTIADALLQSALESPEMAEMVSKEIESIAKDGPIEGLTPDIANRMKEAGVDSSVLDAAMDLRATDTETKTEIVAPSIPRDVSTDAHVDTMQIRPAETDAGGVVVVAEYKDGHLDDVIFRSDDDESETRLSDVVNDIKDDPTAQQVFREVGEDVTPSDLCDALVKAYDTTSNNDNNVALPDTGNNISKESPSAHPDKITLSPDTDGSVDREAKFAKHNESYNGLMEKPFHSRTNTAVCYHDLARTYNAYKAGIEINGKVPTAGDVWVKWCKFYDANIFSWVADVIANKIYDLCQGHKTPNDVTKNDNPRMEAVLPTDKLGVSDNGHVDAKKIDTDQVKGIELARSTLSPLVGTRFGADMGKVDKGSDNELTIRSTNPNPDKNDSPVQIRLADTSRFTFPDVRLIEFRGAQVLVDPFGRVMFSDNDKYSVGQTLSAGNITKTDKGKEAIACYAESRGLTTEQARDEIAQKLKTRFCDRIEAQYKIEATGMDRIDKNGVRIGVIPAAQERLTALRGQDAVLGRMEVILGKDSKLSAEIREARTKLQGAIKTQEARVDALQSRKSDLETLANKVDNKSLGSLDDRFRAACSSEMRAIGRSAFEPASMSANDKTVVDKAVTAGVAEISARVEKFNANRSELDKISFDPKTGDYVDRFGFNQKGEYVGNRNGPFMADGVTGPASMSQEDVDKYKAEHFDEKRFQEAQHDIDAPADIDTPNDTDTPEDTDNPNDTDVPEDTDNPNDTDVPEDTDNPNDADVPEDTDNPNDTDVPEDTDNPNDTDVPEDTDNPNDADVPEDTDNPNDADAPEDTDNPNDADVPEDTDNPNDADVPEDTDNPNDTDAPEDAVVADLDDANVDYEQHGAKELPTDEPADVGIADEDTEGAEPTEVVTDPTELEESAEKLDTQPDSQDGEIEPVDATVAATGDVVPDDDEKPKEVTDDAQDKKDDIDTDFPSEFTDALQGLKDLLEDNLSPDELIAKAEGIAEKVVAGLDAIVDPVSGEADSAVITQFAEQFVDIIASPDSDITEPVSIVIETLGAAVGDGAIGSSFLDALETASVSAETPDVIEQLLKDTIENGSAVAGADIPTSTDPVVHNEDKQPGDISSDVDMGTVIDEILDGQPYEFEITEAPDTDIVIPTDDAAIHDSIDAYQTLELGIGIPDPPPIVFWDAPSDVTTQPDEDVPTDQNVEHEVKPYDAWSRYDNDAPEAVAWGD